MRCPYCQNRFSKSELHKILNKRSSFCVCTKCKEEVHFIDFYASYTSETSNLINLKSETDFTDLIKDLISLRILKDFGEGMAFTLSVGNLDEDITNNPTEENLSIIQLAVEIIKFTISKYYSDEYYANYILQLLLLAIELDFASYETATALLKKENRKIDKIMEDRYFEAIEISIREAVRKITWYQKLLIDSNGVFHFGPGYQNVICSEEILSLIGLGLGMSVSPFMKNLEITGAINFIVNSKEKLAKIKKTNDSFFQKIKNIWK